MSGILEWLSSSISEDEASRLEELRESSGEEYLDPKKVDLIKVYHKLNKMLFDGKLGIYPMKWNRRKSSGALVKFSKKEGIKVGVDIVHTKEELKAALTRQNFAKGEKATKFTEIKILSIEVSTHTIFTMQALENRLAHEMIHVMHLEKGLDYGHNRHFISEMKRINSMGKGITVTITEAGDAKGVAYKGNKRFGVFIFKSGGQTGVYVVPEKNMDAFADGMVLLFPKYRFPTGRRYDVYISDVSELQGYPNPRAKMKKLPSAQVIDKSFADKIIRTGVYKGYVSPDEGKVFH